MLTKVIKYAAVAGVVNLELLITCTNAKKKSKKTIMSRTPRTINYTRISEKNRKKIIYNEITNKNVKYIEISRTSIYIIRL